MDENVEQGKSSGFGNEPTSNHHGPATWREFLGIRFDHHITVQERMDHDGTHSYSAMNCPPAEEFIRQSDPDPTIVERILEVSLSFLERKCCLDDIFPIYLDLALRLQSRLSELDLVDEHVVRLFHAQLHLTLSVLQQASG
ncbi:hypothetical protein ARMGADRAFT_1078529 [Armillaria gallica]|uniref:Uncharacterized protein n=1 Tax=Armillaria gallica TaxID=47427 RepID=A0A2H3DLB5_ARMGA|nr:hypothetical protein ARMGADRAFT_1078529 [Armillaria gallica]